MENRMMQAATTSMATRSTAMMGFDRSLERTVPFGWDLETDGSTGAPHPLQNLASDGSSLPHMRQNMGLDDSAHS